MKVLDRASDFVGGLVADDDLHPVEIAPVRTDAVAGIQSRSTLWYVASYTFMSMVCQSSKGFHRNG